MATFVKMVNTARILTILVPLATESSRKTLHNDTKFIIIHPFYKIWYNIFNNNMKMSPQIFKDSQEKSIHGIMVFWYNEEPTIMCWKSNVIYCNIVLYCNSISLINTVMKTCKKTDLNKTTQHVENFEFCQIIISPYTLNLPSKELSNDFWIVKIR